MLAPAQQTEAVTAPVRILLVEDDQDDYVITRDYFAEISGSRYALEWVRSFDEAFERIHTNRYDLCLVDYRMGERSGLELIEQARRDGLRTPMILLTGQSEREVDLKAMRAGAVDFLVKDQINPVFLERAVRYALERNRAEDKSRKLAAFAQFNPNPVMEFSENSALLYFNEAARKMAISLGGDSPEAMLPVENPAIVRRCLESGENRLDLQTQLRSRTFSWSYFPIPGSRVVHCYVTELTERLQLEAQLRHAQKMEAVGQLAAGVAHDFNNILTIIEGHAALLANHHPAGSPFLRPLREIRDAAERAGNLIRQLLMFSRKQILKPRPLELDQIVLGVSSMLQRTLGEHIRLSVKTEPGLPKVQADPVLMEQLLMNLGVNSRDAMPKGGLLMIDLRAVVVTPEKARQNAEARPGQFVCLSVSDTGCGIHPDSLDRIFEPFFTTKEVGKGTGLGLASVYGTVKQHKGWIEVRSELGRGTVFQIFLPALVFAAEPPEVKPAPAAPHGGCETVLVVEDEPGVRGLVAEILRSHGYRVFCASSGTEAIGIWEQYREAIDLLITDMVMPGMMGRELAERLQKDDPTLRVVYTSGYSPGMAGQDLALLEGFNFLPKPYPPARLVRQVRECLDAPAASQQ